jgi:hypothetical protein
MRTIREQLSIRMHNGVLKYFFSRDGLVLLLLPIIATLISFYLRPNFLVSILLFLGLPSLYIAFRVPKYLSRAVIFSLVASIPLMIIIEYVGGDSLSWAFPPSFFDFHLFGRVSLEVVIWAFFNVLSVVLFYEFIFDHHHGRLPMWNGRMWSLLRYIGGWVLLFVIFLSFSKDTSAVPYFYFCFGVVVFLYPIFMTWLYYPRILPKIGYTAFYFTFLSVLYEVVALNLGWWSFPGEEFIGSVSFQGIQFPLEELFFWILLFAPAVACAFEYLEDDHH